MTPTPPSMTRRRRLAAIVAVAVAFVPVTGVVVAWTGEGAGAPSDTAHEAGHHTDAPKGDRIDRVVFGQDMRRLWEDHITWTRLFIVSATADLPDVDATAGRLLQNQVDIGTAIAPFYGDDAAAALTALLRDHILIAADLVAAAKSGDSAAVAAHLDRWYANGDDIARFLAGANPAWAFDQLRQMMRTHLDQTLAEATARLAGDWAADIAEYDHIHHHILEMADTLAAGIIEQFPRRFTRGPR